MWWLFYRNDDVGVLCCLFDPWSNSGVFLYLCFVDNNFLGCFAEYLFCAECTKRGFIVSMPVLHSSPYDCILDVNGKLLKVQIKSSQKTPSDRLNSVCVPLQNSKTIYTKSLVDYFAVYSEYYDGFFVFPNKGEMKSIRLSLIGRNKIYFRNFDFNHS